jgi:hypothetical protein
MANIVITSTTNSIQVNWNVHKKQWSREQWHKSSAHFYLEDAESHVQASEDNGTTVLLSYNGATGTMQVDSVDGVAPTSNSDLYNKLTALTS